MPKIWQKTGQICQKFVIRTGAIAPINRSNPAHLRHLSCYIWNNICLFLAVFCYICNTLQPNPKLRETKRKILEKRKIVQRSNTSAIHNIEIYTLGLDR